MLIRGVQLFMVLSTLTLCHAHSLQQLSLDGVSASKSTMTVFQALLDAGDIELAESQLIDEIERQSASERGLELAENFHALAQIALLKNQYSRGLEYYQKALDIVKTSGAKIDEAYLYLDLGRTYRLMGMHQSAFGYFNLAKEIFRTENHNEGIALEQLEAGLALHQLGQLENALSQLQRALLSLRQMNDRTSAARTLMALATVHNKLGDENTALVYLQEASALIITLTDQWLAAELAYHWGLVNFNLNNFEEALRSLEESHSIFKQFYALCDIDKVNAYIGKVMAAKGNINAGITVLSDTLKNVSSHSCSTLEIELHLALAELLLKSEDPRVSLHIEQGITLAKNRGDLFHLAAYEALNVQIFESRNHYKDALFAVKSQRLHERESVSQRRALALQYLQSQQDEERNAQNLAILNQNQAIKLAQAQQDELEIRVFYASLFVSLLIVFLFWSRYNQRQRSRFLRKEVKLRTQELESKNNELESAYRALERASLLDPLTGLYNRQFLNNQLPQEIQRAQNAYLHEKDKSLESSQSDMICFLLDIDNFKIVNDTYGHLGGDHILVELSNVLRTVFRPSDLLIRWGGEEFLCVCRNTPRTKAVSLAERLHSNLHDHKFTLHNKAAFSITCSIGFCVFPLYASHPSQLDWPDYFALLDECLYASKNSGKDCWIGMVGEKPATATATSPIELKYKLPPMLIHTSLNNLSSINWNCT